MTFLRSLLRFAFLSCAAAVFAREPEPAPPVFPIPQEMELSSIGLALDESVRILLPLEPSPEDVFLARELTAELSDRFGIALRTERVPRVPDEGKVIVMGAHTNPLVTQLSSTRRLTVTSASPEPEGYLLAVDDRVVLVAGRDDAGTFYGLQSLRQLVQRTKDSAEIRGARIRDWAYKPFRAVKLYLPGRDNIPFFKRFVRDFMALHKYNQLILETNAAMRLNRHPELNAGWIEFARNMTETRRDRPAGPHGEYVDSTHYDAGDGLILEQDEVADLVRWARQYRIDVIPELPSLSHSYYLLTRHRELAEVPTAEWPDAYCPSNPKSYELLFDVLDEYLDVIKPKVVHVGHDEWRIPVPTTCERCAGQDARELYAADLKKIHDHLAARNVGTAIWGDHLIEGVRGVATSEAMQTRGGQTYRWPGALTPAQVSDQIPKDILIANWFWRPGKKGEGEPNELQVEAWGFRQFFGNFNPNIPDWERRSARASVIGGAPSSWAATTEFNFGKDLLYEFLGCANLLWSKHWPTESALQPMIQAMMPDVRARLGGRVPYTAPGARIATVDISVARIARLPSAGRGGVIETSGVTFDLGEPAGVMRTTLGAVSPPIAVGVDATSLVFLQACEKPARNGRAYYYIFNFEDSADLLGHYEVLYEDGFVATIPIRYGVNILERTWAKSGAPQSYCYQADPVDCDNETVFFSFEWLNPRLGKLIKSVTFHGSSGYRSTNGKALEDNAVLLKALSVVKAKPSARSDERKRVID